MKRIRLFVVDDHVLFRHGLISLLSDMPEFQVVGEAGSGEEALHRIPQQDVDVVLLDVNMPGLNGVDTLWALRKQGYENQVLMLTVSQQEEHLIGAILAGASGYVLKNVEPETLRRTLLDVVQGKAVLSPEMTTHVLKIMRRSGERQAQEGLSKREQQVLRCLAHGSTTAQIAAELYISENTVKTHIRHILKKLKVNNRVEAVAKATQEGLI